MKRILLALNPENVNREAIDFACYLSKLAHTRVTGVFLKDDYTPATTTPVEAFVAEEWAAAADPAPKSLLAQALSHFKDACICREASYLIHQEQGITVDALIEASRFSDLLILPSGLSLEHEVEAAPSSLVKHVLSKADCPVILAQETFDGVDEIIFAYNGSKASVFAIKQFTYLFPEFRNSKATILAVNASSSTRADEAALMEWMGSHYHHIEYTFSHGDPADQLVSHLLSRNNALVVMGAYGRNSFSRFMKRSTAEPVSGTLFNPIFIAH